MRRAKKMKDMRPGQRSPGSPAETKAAGGYSPRQHQDVVPQQGHGPGGTVASQVPWGATPPVPPPPVGSGKGFKGI